MSFKSLFFRKSLVFRATRVNHQRRKTFKDEYGEVVTRQVLVVCLHCGQL